MSAKKVIMSKLVSLNKMDRSFDLEFWDKVGVQGRFQALWQMVLEAEAIKGKNAEPSRLQRSVQNIKRRKS